MQIVFILELIGTIAFAVSGAMVGILKKMDLLGVIILSLTTAVGGGVVRDLILNQAPPAAFTNPVFALTAIVTGMIVFLPSVRRVLHANEKAYERTLLWMDSIGLGLFTVIGMQAAYRAIDGANAFLTVFVGVLTGVGGGVLRDVFAGQTPYIFVKHFYATASIIGACLCALMWRRVGYLPAMITGAGITVLLRILAARYRWHLPVAR